MKSLEILTPIALTVLFLASCGQNNEAQSTSNEIDNLLLKDYYPVSAFVMEEHHPSAAKFTTVDMHSHAYVDDVESLQEWAKILEENNIERIVINTMAHGEEFDRLYDMYKGVSDKFELWCAFNDEHWGTPEWEEEALADLQHCYEKGAVGVGELGDKGWGEIYSIIGLNLHDDEIIKTAHIDNPVFDKLLEKCGELHMPVSFHAADPIWMYLPLDEKNDGYVNAKNWAIDTTQAGILGYEGIMKSFENAVARHPNTLFIGCHFINMSHDYARLGALLDKYPNLIIDNSARHCETSVTPRATKAFYEKYQDRIIFGTDNYPDRDMYKLMWRVLETEDEHFYDDRAYHWALNGIGLGDDVLHKIYHDNAVKITEYEGRK